MEQIENEWEEAGEKNESEKQNENEWEEAGCKKQKQKQNENELGGRTG